VKKQSRFDRQGNRHERSDRRFSGECGRHAAVRPRLVGRMPCMRASGLLLGCILLIGLGLNAAAQEPAGAKLALDKARKECRTKRGLRLTVQPRSGSGCAQIAMRVG